MHEFGLAASTLDIALEKARGGGASRITRLSMRIGVLSGVVEEAFRFAFEALTRGTMAEGAELMIDRVPVTCYCRACSREFTGEAAQYVCPECGSASTELRRGRELELVSLEVG